MSIKAFYDPINDKIWNAKKGTLFYYHEEGHRFLYKNGTEASLGTIVMFSILFCLGFLTNQHYLLAKISLGFCLIPFIYSELYAWGYAFKKYKNEKSKKM